MKSCPACKRTFEDTTVFCLVDGSILSAPFDPNAPQPECHPPPTEVLKAPPDTRSAQTTITNPTPFVPPPTNPISAERSNEVSTSSNRKFLFVGVGLALFGLFVSGALLLIFLGSSQNCPSIRVHCFPSSDSTTCSVVVDERSVQINKSLDTNSLLCSLSPVLGLQAPSLPNSVTNVSWTASNGTVKSDPTYKHLAEIDTNGLSGREITVTAKVSGYSWRCSNTATTTFVAK